jgi:hypothetical protein
MSSNPLQWIVAFQRDLQRVVALQQYQGNARNELKRVLEMRYAQGNDGYPNDIWAGQGLLKAFD